ncbi:MAG: tRNA dihydrouridine synthase DusB [Tistrella sp.]|uniref:tRNA dihydrouridine synthase DusB n=1 Tax=Tistrella sp. TaxID=2024861 RepID=UPI000C5525CD|nr:tRNA dihydrouridine synthase DusB [Tistrella sp.]MAD35837.1 tRNA dihydrouridine synthase DusB [Tistrella sp.]MBA78139.1 tRNA dihydrouridine synthase DusB [Tistrella sp.]
MIDRLFSPDRAAPPVLLAPMAGVTDRPFRTMVRRFGVSATVSEMIAGGTLVEGCRRTLSMIDLAGEPGPVAVQLAGRDPEVMAEAAEKAVEAGAAWIDINMGCPAKKVTSGACGAALMREPDRAEAIVRAVIHAAGSVPVTVKMRLGWAEGELSAPDLAARLEQIGVAMITVHGRTRAQLYKGAADPAGIAAVRRRVRVPLIANGDVASPADARRLLDRTGADGVMIGRATMGRPWLPALVMAGLAGRSVAMPDMAAIWALARAHYDLALDHYGEAHGRRVVRKHLDAYATVAGAGRAIRDHLVRAEQPDDVRAVLDRLALGDLPADFGVAA